jgi:hypothetical protein
MLVTSQTDRSKIESGSPSVDPMVGPICTYFGVASICTYSGVVGPYHTVL